MTADRRHDLGLMAACAAVFLAARGALHVTTFGLPLSTDDAVPMIQVHMLRHGQPVTTLINQPYNGTLDTYLIAPLTFLLSWHDAFRAYQILAAAALVAAIALLARRVAGREASWAAALLASLGSPYMAMNTAIGPVPNFLVGVVAAAVLLLLWPAAGERGQPPPGIGRGFAAGLTAGLGTWNTALTVPCLAGSMAGLSAAGVPLARAFVGFVPGFALGLVPMLLGRWIGASGVTETNTVQPYAVRTIAHWGEGLAAISRTWQGLFGVRIPLVVDGPEWTAFPTLVRALLALVLVMLLGLGIRRRALPLLGWAIAFSAAFALSSRTDPTYVRYAYNLTVPFFALVASGLVRVWRWRKPAALALAAIIAVQWVAGQQIVLRHWRDPQHAARVWQVPDLRPTLATLERDGVRSAYASLAFACRIVVETQAHVLASQAWNERMPGDPLRYRDEVDLDPHAAWVLSSWLSRGMPRAAGPRQGGFAEDLRDIGGAWREETNGDVTVYSSFRPPFDESRPVAREQIGLFDESGAALPPTTRDRDGRTAWRAASGIARGTALVVRVTPARRLSAVVFAVDLERSPLGVPWVATIDGRIVARRHRFALQWIGGVPRAGKQALLAVGFPEPQTASEVRVVFQDAGPPLAVSEVFAYGPDEPVRAASGAAPAAAAYERARVNRWAEAVGLYEEAVRLEPERASYHAALARARWRAGHRQHLDVESLDDGGAAVLRLPER